MKDLRRIGGVAVVLLVLLRVSVGWQFLYEGMWKWDTWDSAKPWTSRGFLVNAKGPFRQVFHQMAGDPHDLEWLEYSTPYEGSEERVPYVEERWDQWLIDFSYHYGLTDAEYGRLSRLVRGREYLTSDPFVVPWDWEEEFSHPIVELEEAGEDEETGEQLHRLKIQTAVIDGNDYWHPKRHLVPKDREKLLSLVPDVSESSPGVFGSEDLNDSHVTYAEQVHLLYERQAKLTYFERLRAQLFGDPDIVTYSIGEDEERIGKVEQYERRVEAYEEALASASTPYEHDLLEYEWGKLQELKSELVGPIRSLEAEMKAAAYNTLTPEQRALGPMPEPMTRQRVADIAAIWSLIVLGALLILGLFSRFAAILGAGMVFTFYLVWPPFPGVPEAPGPEHALIVNKNFIEALALLALAAMPTGTWFGIDGLLGRAFGSRRTSTPKSAKESDKSKSDEKDVSESKSLAPPKPAAGKPSGATAKS